MSFGTARKLDFRRMAPLRAPIYAPDMVNLAEVHAHDPSYEPPTLIELGSVAEHTLNGCLLGKQWGGSDGFSFMGINVPISNCSR